MRAYTGESKEILRVDPSFVKVIAMNDTDTVVRVAYKAHQTEALKRGLLTVRVTLSHVSAPIPRLTDTGSRGARGLVDNLLMRHQLVQDARRQVRENVIHRYTSDITRAIDNTRVAGIVAGSGQVARLAFKPIEKSRATGAVSGANMLARRPTPTRLTQNLALQLIALEGIDPSEVDTVGNQIHTSRERVEGISRLPSARSELLMEYLKAIATASQPQTLSDNITQSLEYDETDEIELWDEIVVPERFDRLNEIVFKFELLYSDGEVFNTVTRKIAPSREVDVFRTPKRAPKVRAVKSQTPGLGSLSISQTDSVAEWISIYRRTLLSSSPIDSEAYTHLGDFQLKVSDGVRPFDVEIDSAGVNVFRVIALGANKIASSEFTNVVVRSHHDAAKVGDTSFSVAARRFVHVSLTTRIVPNGVAVDLRAVPQDAAAVQILRRDMTTHEKEFSIMISHQVTQRDVYTYVDTEVTGGHIYEYSCDVVFPDGDIETQTSDVIEYTVLSQNLVDTRITDVQVLRDETNYDVTFNVSSKLVPTTLDAVRAALQQQDLLKYFEADVLKERDSLQKMIAHSITRIDLTTGQRESFGVLTDTTFSDATLRDVNAVTPLVSGHQYRYEVSTLIRQPETMFVDLEKEVVDPLSGRTYKMSPAKFMHPVTLTKGNITSTSTLKANHAKDQFSFGNTGNVAAIDITLQVAQPIVTSVTAKQLDPTLVEIDWRVDGDNALVDHFLVMMVSSDGREIIGKCHANHQGTDFTYYHTIDRRHTGEYVYVIVPILTDYSKGGETAAPAVFLNSEGTLFTPIRSTSMSSGLFDRVSFGMNDRTVKLR